MRAQKKIWIDVLTPKQVLFTKAMIERAPGNVKISVTTRNYSELNKFVSQIGLEHNSFGRHGGGDLEEKLEASVERTKELVSFASDNNFDLCLSYISPEAARVSFGLGLKSFICSDSPHANAPSRLAIPLARKLFSPFPIRKARWTRYGIVPSSVLSYHALDPWAWLLSRKRTIKKNSNKLVLVRLEESFASYAKSGRGVSNMLQKIVQKIQTLGDFEITIIPRYDEQRSWAERKFGKTCTVPKSTVDGVDLILNSALVIGGGGTMTQEAALLGVPNISYFPSAELDVFENYYFPRRLSYKASTPRELLNAVSLFLKDADAQRSAFSERAKVAVRNFEDPVKFVLENMLSD